MRPDEHTTSSDLRQPPALGSPLHGLTVVAIEQAVAAPVATRHLADLGARVIKIERVGSGDFARDYDDVVKGMASHFVWLNRNKESVELDFTTAPGREILERLLGSADVFVQNVGRRAALRAELDADSVLARHPAIVACEITGYGASGPYAAKPAYDLIVQAETGSIAITGRPGHLAKPGVAVADIGAGMYAYSTILAALYERRVSGTGRAIQVSLFDTVVEWMNYSLYFARYMGADPEPLGIGTQAICPYGGYPTRDGQLLVVAVQNEREWERLCSKVIERLDLLDDQTLRSNGRRVAQRARVDAACAAAFGAMTLAEARERLDSARIANGLVRSVSEVLEHPQLLARGRKTTVETPAGTVDALLPPPIVGGWQARMGPVPGLGEHTSSVLAELGYAPGDVERLTANGVVGAA